MRASELALASTLLLAACTPDFDALVRGGDAGPSTTNDAHVELDATMLDAGDARDAAEIGDAGEVVDARSDAARPDGCPSALERCDGSDDDCDTRIDEGALCDAGLACREGACRLPSGTLLWSHVFGASVGAAERGRDRGLGAIAFAGGVAIAGDYESGSIALGGPSLPVAAGGDAFLATFDTDGASTGALSIGGGGPDVGQALALGPSDALVVGGIATGTVDFGGGATSGGSGGFVARYADATAASFLDALRLPGSSRVLALASAGSRAAAGGSFEGTITPPCGSFSAPTGASRGIVALRDGTTLTWCVELGGTGAAQVNGVAMDASGARVLAIGGFFGDATFGSDAYTARSQDAFVVSLDASTGAFQRSLIVSGSMLEEGVAAVALEDGDFVIGGRYEGSASVGSTALPVASVPRLYLARLDGETLDVVWVRSALGTSPSRAWSLDASGEVLLVHGTHAGLELAGCAALPGAGADDLFVARLAASDGACVWARSIGGAGVERAGAVAVGPRRVYVVASVDDGAVVGSETVTTLGEDAAGNDSDVVLLAYEL